MKLFAMALATALALTGLATTGHSQTNNPDSDKFKALITQVRADIKAGKTSEKDLADDLKQFDTLLAAENDRPTEQAANIVYWKAMLYKQIIHDEDKAKALTAEITAKYPDSKVAASLKKQAEAEKKLAALAKGATFPDFDEKDVNGNPISVGNYKGKVVLVDFWATWCGPCRGELPNVVETYGKYHDKGFEIIGVSLDDDKDKLTSFTKENKMTWAQYFDGKGWQNKLAEKYGIQSIPATVLVNGDGVIIGRDLRGEDLTQAVAAAVGAK